MRGFCSFLVCLLVAGVALFAFDGAAAEDATESAKKYPPYPDIWGRELPVPENVYTGLDAYPMANGDVWFEFSRKRESKPPGDGSKGRNRDRFLFKFFENSLTPIPNEEADVFFRQLWRTKYAAERKRSEERDRARGNRPSTSEEFSRNLGVGVIFEDGGSVVMDSLGYARGFCWANFDNHIVSKDAQGKVVADKMLFYLFEKPKRRNLGTFCWMNYNDEYLDFRFKALGFSMTPLGDESFLAVGERFIIRFDRDLRAPFVDAHPRLFLVDTAEIMAILDRVGGVNSALRDVNDAILALLLERQKKKMKKE